MAKVALLLLLLFSCRSIAPILGQDIVFPYQSSMGQDHNFEQKVLKEINNLKKDNEDLRSEVKDLKDTVDILQEELWEVADVVPDFHLRKMMSVPESCEEIKAHGVTTSHIYPLDPDGKGRVY